MAGGRIELVSLTKRFSEVAVDNIDLQIASGEFFSLLGPSGCGKTTTLRLIAGFEQPTSGRILLDGIDVSAVPPHRRNVNTVFQSYALFPFLTVFDNVAFGLRNKRLAKAELEQRVYSALELVKLRSFEKRRPGQLSGGQQQRVALARALVLQPSVLLLDEPLGALDAKLRRSLKVELKALQEQVGITFLYVTHDQEEALTMSDRLAVMRDGKIVQIGPPDAGVRGACRHLRRRLPRRVEPDAGRHRLPRAGLRVRGPPRRRRPVRRARRPGRRRTSRTRSSGRSASESRSSARRARTGCPPWSSAWSTSARPRRCTSGSRPVPTSRQLLQNDGAQSQLSQGTPVHAYLAADALRVLSGGASAADLNATSAEPETEDVRQAS